MTEVSKIGINHEHECGISLGGSKVLVSVDALAKKWLSKANRISS